MEIANVIPVDSIDHWLCCIHVNTQIAYIMFSASDQFIVFFPNSSVRFFMCSVFSLHYSCFIKDQTVFFAAFLGPLFLLILMNVVMYISITVVLLRYICCKQKERLINEEDKHNPKNNVCQNFMLVLKLWCISCTFGLTWLFGALTVSQSASFVFSTLFSVFTSLQGFFIFVFLCLLNKDTSKCYKTVCCKWNKSYQTSESRSLTTKSSSVATKNLDNSLKPTYDDATKVALARELSTKIKQYEPETDVIETSTFKPVKTEQPR